MLVVTLAILALPALVAADTSYLGNVLSGCAGAWPKDKWSQAEGNRQKIANNGAYTVVFRDAMSVEAGVTCPKLTLNAPGGNYVYTYKEKNGETKTVTGSLTWSNDVFTLDKMPKGHFGADCGLFASTCAAKLRATAGNENLLHVMTERGFWFFCTRNSYFLVPSGTVASNCKGCTS